MVSTDAMKFIYTPVYQDVINNPLSKTQFYLGKMDDLPMDIGKVQPQYDFLLANGYQFSAPNNFTFNKPYVVKDISAPSTSGVSDVKVDTKKSVNVETKRADNGINKTSQSRTAEQIISDRTKGLDLNPHPIQQKQLIAEKMKELREKVENRTITKAEYKQYIWNKKFSKHRASGVADFWYQERQRVLNNETPTRNWSQEQLNDILNGKKPKVDGETVQSHNSYSASQFLHLANKGEIIYPTTPNEHFKGWHGGN